MFGTCETSHYPWNEPGKDADLTGKFQCYHFSVSRAGYVLAGGRSSRMGRDKALLPIQGRTLVERVARAVEAAAGSVVLVGNPALSECTGYPAIPDIYPGEGPLGGILTALRHTGAEWNLVTACDMPELTPAFLTYLFDTALRSGGDIVMPAGATGLPEPLCAVYRETARGPMEARFAEGTRKVTDAFRDLHTIVLQAPEQKLFHNINTPQDWAGYAAG